MDEMKPDNELVELTLGSITEVSRGFANANSCP